MIHSREASPVYTCVVTIIIHVHHLTYIHVLGHISFTTHICTYRDMTHSSMQSLVYSRVETRLIHESYLWVMTRIVHIFMGHDIHRRVMSHIPTSHVTHTDEPYTSPTLLLLTSLPFDEQIERTCIHMCEDTNRLRTSSHIYICAGTWFIPVCHHSYIHVPRHDSFTHSTTHIHMSHDYFMHVITHVYTYTLIASHPLNL